MRLDQQLLLKGSHQLEVIIPVLSLPEDYERNGISCQLVNKSTPWIQFTIKSVKSANDSRYVVQRLSENHLVWNMVYVSHGKCSFLTLKLLFLLIVVFFSAVVSRLLNMVEPEQVNERRRRTLKRRPFLAAGVNDVWPQDQHDKWGRFGLWLHAGLDAFSGEINWLKILWTNKNPRLIAKHYIDTCRRIGGKLSDRSQV